MALSVTLSASAVATTTGGRFNVKRTSPGRRAARPAARGLVVRVAADSDYDAVVIGAGVSGLSTAFTLGRSSPGVRMLVTEARDRVGGNITTKNENGYIWEEGPNSYQPGDAILTVACDAGMRDDILLADPNSDRYVLWDKELRALPKDIPTAVLGTFLTWPGKIRAGLGAIGIRPPPPGKEESVKEFVSRNLGTEAFERLIEPFCSGVYAGDPAMLSSVAATGRVQRLEPLGGSLVFGALKAQKEAYDAKKAKGPRDPRLPKVEGQTVGSFRGGLRTFPEGLAKALGSEKVKLEWKVTKIAKRDDGSFAITYDTPDGEKTITTATVVMTAPAYVTADTVQDMAPDAAAALRKFYYPPVASVTVSYPEDSFRLDGTSALPGGGLTGFGQLHPRSQGIRTLGTIYSSYLFKDDKRQPEGEFMILNYIGGARDTGITQLSDEELVKAQMSVKRQELTTESRDARVSLLQTELASRNKELLAARVEAARKEEELKALREGPLVALTEERDVALSEARSCVHQPSRGAPQRRPLRAERHHDHLLQQVRHPHRPAGPGDNLALQPAGQRPDLPDD